MRCSGVASAHWFGPALGRSLSYACRSNIPIPPRALRAALYGATVFLSFFLMLVFMTYNVRSCYLMLTIPMLIYSGAALQAYLILAVVFGASLGHFVLNGYLDVEGVLLGGGGDAKGMACH